MSVKPEWDLRFDVSKFVLVMRYDHHDAWRDVAVFGSKLDAEMVLRRLRTTDTEGER